MASKVPMRQVRMDDALHAKVCFIADNEERSFNAEVVFILKSFVQQYERQHGPIPAGKPDTADTPDNH